MAHACNPGLLLSLADGRKSAFELLLDFGSGWKFIAFQGMVSLNNFTIKRNLTYRNSFLPITFGQVYSTSVGSQINLTIKMGKFQFFAFVTWTILLGIFSIYSLFILLMELSYSGQLAGWTLVGPIMFLVGYLYVITNFKKEMISTKRFLTTLVDPKEI